MKKFVTTQIQNQLQKVKDYFDSEAPEFVVKVIPQVFMEKLTKYHRVEIEGLEKLPKSGGVLIAPNHSGYAGLDAMTLNYEIYKQTGRIARVLTHRLWFAVRRTAISAQKLGFIEATTKNGIENLKKGRIVIIFPEGEQGNFKSSRKMYVLQEFKRGFIRMALQAQVPIIPTLILGAEESHLNLAMLKLPRWLQGIIMPLPLNLLPFPAKWRIIMLDPITLPYNPEAAEDAELVREIAADIQDKMQERLNQEVAKRKTVYFSS